jgi:hypothetical protein
MIGEMTPANRLRESLAAVVLVGVRLHFHPWPVDWIVILGLCWAVLPFSEHPRYRTAVACAGAAALSALHVQPQLLHLLAVTDLLP